MRYRTSYVDRTKIRPILVSAGEPLSLTEIGTRLGVCVNRYWTYPAYEELREGMLWLREQGRAVKLPHEGTRASAVYAACDSPEQATRMQRDACETLLSVTEPGTAKHRMLTQALFGLIRLTEEER